MTQAEDPEFRRAVSLEAEGRVDDAKQAYLAVLARDSAHLGALRRLAALLYATGYRAAALTVYREILKHAPEDADNHAKLGVALFVRGDFVDARQHFETALHLAPEHGLAHQGYGSLLMELREQEKAWFHLEKGCRDNAVVSLPFRGQGAPVPVLLLNSLTGGNVPILHLLDNQIYQALLVAVEFRDPALPLPAHRLVFNAIGDADICGAALGSVESVLAHTTAPVINAPRAVAATGRADNALRLGLIPGVITAKTTPMTRQTLSGPDAERALKDSGLSFPLLFRAQGFHAGKHFIKVDRASELSAALCELPGDELLAIEFLATRSPDGKIRKYRVMFVGGQIYPLHAAVSEHWKIHYFSADMADNAEHRAEDQAFLENMPQVLGEQATRALERINQTLGLDYAGVDFSLDAAGNVLLFEANATMTVLPPSAEAHWDYRRAPVARITNAVAALLAERVLGHEIR